MKRFQSSTLDDRMRNALRQKLPQQFPDFSGFISFLPANLSKAYSSSYKEVHLD